MGFFQALIFVVVWTAMFVLNIIITEQAVRLYNHQASEVLVYEAGYGLTGGIDGESDFQFSQRFLLIVGGMALALLASWFLLVQLFRQPRAFDFIMGALMLTLATIDIRHLQNIFLFRHVGTPNGVEGKLAYPAWLGFRMSSIQFFAFAAFFLLVALLIANWFIAGGAFGSALFGVSHWISSSKHLKSA